MPRNITEYQKYQWMESIRFKSCTSTPRMAFRVSFKDQVYFDNLLAGLYSYANKMWSRKSDFLSQGPSKTKKDDICTMILLCLFPFLILKTLKDLLANSGTKLYFDSQNQRPPALLMDQNELQSFWLAFYIVAKNYNMYQI